VGSRLRVPVGAKIHNVSDMAIHSAIGVLFTSVAILTAVIPDTAVIPSIGSGAELTMIQLQDLMSQRQNDLELTRQIMERMNQTTRDMMKNCPTCFAP
jgi:hypothetical protein